MNRREALKYTGSSLSGLLFLKLFLPRSVLAETVRVEACVPPADKQLLSDISSNHRHSFDVKLEDLICNRKPGYSIQGAANHPHQVTLSDQDLLQLVRTGATQVDSTRDVGHSHTLRLTLR